MTTARPVTPRPLAVAVCALVLATSALAACSSDDGASATSTTTTEATTTTAPGPPAGATEAGLRGLAAGTCFLLPEDDDPEAKDRAVWVVDCANPHTHEVYDVVDYDGPVLRGGGYAGVDAVQDWAEQACFGRFEAFVGIPWTRSSLEIETWWPSEESWGRGDRTVLCTVFPETGGSTTGTLRGSAE